MFCRSLYVLLYFFFWPLCCLSFDLRILITPLVSSNSSCLVWVTSSTIKLDCILLWQLTRSAVTIATLSFVDQPRFEFSVFFFKCVTLISITVILVPPRWSLWVRIKLMGGVYSIQHYGIKFVNDLRHALGHVILGSNLRSTVLDSSTITITQPMRLLRIYHVDYLNVIENHSIRSSLPQQWSRRGNVLST